MMTTLAKVKSWQWVVIGGLVGLIGSTAVGLWGDPMLSRLGESINGQAEFELALTKVEGGRPCFTDLRVREAEIHDEAGRVRKVMVVSGMYFDGRPWENIGSDNAMGPVWRPAFYVAETPYRPVFRRAGEAAKAFERLAEPTAVDFLTMMGKLRGVRFSHAWWESPRWVRRLWWAVGIGGVGLVWPAVLNLVVFGSVRRPKEEQVDLNPSTPTDEGAAAAVSAEVRAEAMDKVDEMVEELSGQQGNPEETSVVAESIRVLAPVATLEGGKLEPLVVEEGRRTTFGTRAGDFYPTERKAGQEGEESGR